MKETKRRKELKIVVAIFLVFIIAFTITGCELDSLEEKTPISISKIENGVYIIDDNKIIDDSVEIELNKMLVELEEKTEVEFYIITVDSLLGKDIDSYYDELYNTLEIGKKEQENDVLLLVSKSDAKVRLGVGSEMLTRLNVPEREGIIEKYFEPYSENGDYTIATKYTVQATLTLLEKEYDIEINGLERRYLEFEKVSSSEILTGVITIGIILIVCILVGYFENKKTNIYDTSLIQSVTIGLIADSEFIIIHESYSPKDYWL